MDKKATTKRLSTSHIEDFTVTVRQARFKFSESGRESKIVRFADNDERIVLRNFVKDKFHSIECRYFVQTQDADDTKNPKCMCGEMKKYHKQDKSPFNVCSMWNEREALERLPTDTYGKIEFVGEDITNTKLTDFVRIGYTDKMDDVFDLMFNIWGINVGTLCISVVGGANNFKMRKKEKDIFCQGLIKAAKTTNALIITSGLNLGISRLVGDAIQDGQSYLYGKMNQNNAICCIGITPWGFVKKRRTLEVTKGRTIQYKVTDEIKPNKPVSLNKNHTHYLFVDEGRRLCFSNTEAGNFRSAFEKELNKKSEFREAIPVVLLVVEGGHEVFLEARRCVRENVPIVVCEGTGRASDIIGDAFREMQRVSAKIRRDVIPMLPEDYKNILKIVLVEENISKENEVDVAIECIEEIVRNEFLITIFDIKAQEDLDLMILYSLIKKMDFMCDSKQNSISSQLSLCLIWNRVDIVKDKIFSGDISLSNEEWAAFLKESIINGKVEFIELFLQNVSNIQEFLTVVTLKELYEQCPKSKTFRKTFRRLIGREFTKGLLDVKELLSKIIGRYENSCFITGEDIQRPFQELFLWAVLMEKHECAKFFWERCDESLCLALVATRIYRCHQGTTVRDTDRIQKLIEWKNYFEYLAMKLVEECHDIDQETAAYLIEKENPTWGGISCLELAYKAKDINFISSIVCQRSVDFTWRGGVNINFLKCIISIFFPFWVIFGEKYTVDYTSKESKENQEREKDFVPTILKLMRFYLAPQTKFCIHSFTFMGFVIYFSYVVLYGMNRLRVTHHEKIFMAYLCLMIVDKLMEIILSKLNRIQNRLNDWWKFNHWNKIDILIILLGAVAMLLRIPLAESWNSDLFLYFRYSKTIYSIIVGLFYLKVLRFLTIHQNLGPKLEMMIRLVEELLNFVTIIIIFLLSYGVTSQAAYFPQREYHWRNLTNVMDYPYWSIFGKLSLEKTVYMNFCDSNTNYTISNQCAEKNFLMPILFVAYVSISNILLTNVLVATYNNICKRIINNSIEVWKYTMFSLVREYDMKPLFPLPLSILVYIFNLFLFCYRKSGCSYFLNRNKFQIPNIETGKGINIQNLSKGAALMISSDMFIESELDKLVKYFENNSQKIVIKQIATKNQMSIESGVRRLEFKSKSLLKELENLQTKLMKNQITKCEKNVMDRNASPRIQIEDRRTKASKMNSIGNNLSEIKVLLRELKELHKKDRRTDSTIVEEPEDEHSSQDPTIRYVPGYPNNLKENTGETSKTSLTKETISSQLNLTQNEREIILKEFKKRSTHNSQQIQIISENFEQFQKQMKDSISKIVSVMETFNK